MEDLPFYKFVWVITVVFILGGAMGFSLGGFMIQKNWETFWELKEMEIDNHCMCNYALNWNTSIVTHPDLFAS